MQPLCNLLFGSNRYQDGHTVCQKLDHTFSAFSELCKLVCKMLDHNSSVSDRRPHLFCCQIGNHTFLSDFHRVHIGRVGRNAMCELRPQFSLHQSVVCSEILDDHMMGRWSPQKSVYHHHYYCHHIHYHHHNQAANEIDGIWNQG